MEQALIFYFLTWPFLDLLTAAVPHFSGKAKFPSSLPQQSPRGKILHQPKQGFDPWPLYRPTPLPSPSTHLPLIIITCVEGDNNGQMGPFYHMRGTCNWIWIRASSQTFHHIFCSNPLKGVQKLLTEDAIESVPPWDINKGFYSLYLTIPKRDRDLRPILDLRAKIRMRSPTGLVHKSFQTAQALPKFHADPFLRSQEISILVDSPTSSRGRSVHHTMPTADHYYRCLPMGAHLHHHSIGAGWEACFRRERINFLEIRNVIISFQHIIQVKHVTVLSDNMTAVLYVNLQSGRVSKKLCTLALIFGSFAYSWESMSQLLMY